MADELDWGDGDYGRTARTLEPAAEIVLDAAEIAPGELVLDVACGTGNPPWPPRGEGLERSGSTLPRRWWR